LQERLKNARELTLYTKVSAQEIIEETNTRKEALGLK
jgi:hypothetical protein